MDKKQLMGKFSNLEKMMTDPFGMQFDRCWKKLVSNYGAAITNKVKQSFVKSMIRPVHEAINIKLRGVGAIEVAFDADFILDRMDFDSITEAVFHYHLFHTKDLSEYDRARKIKDNNYIQEVANTVAETIIARQNDRTLRSETHELSPEITSCREVCDWVVQLVINIATKNIRDCQGILEIFQNAVITAKGALKLLTEGHGRESFILWRNLHEQECILFVLVKHGEKAAQAYMKHERFAKLEFVEALDRAELDEEATTKAHGDIQQIEYEFEKIRTKFAVGRRDFINYGWLLKLDEFAKGYREKIYKLDFRRGLQTYAGQQDRQEAYSYACKFAHPTYHSMRVQKEGAYKSCIYSLILSISNIGNLFRAFLAAENLYQDEYKRLYLERLLSRLVDSYNILAARV